LPCLTTAAPGIRVALFLTLNALLRRGSDWLTRNIQDLRDVVRQVRHDHPFLIHGWVALPDHPHRAIEIAPVRLLPVRFGVRSWRVTIPFVPSRRSIMNFSIECEEEIDGRWIAEIPQLPGVLCYGTTADDAMSKAEVLALRAMAERLEHGESHPVEIRISLPLAA
jgi:predicted RNase H-like HicB family nuclease